VHAARHWKDLVNVVHVHTVMVPNDQVIEISGERMLCDGKLLAHLRLQSIQNVQHFVPVSTDILFVGDQNLTMHVNGTEYVKEPLH
jgi:hypothetical protein